MDRDFRSDADLNALNHDHGVFVLPVHEVENYFLHPGTLSVLLQQNGRGAVPTLLIRDAADARAGSWIFQHTMATRNAKALPEMSAGAKELAKGLTWEQIDANRGAAVQRIVAATGYGADDRRRLGAILEISCGAYSRKRGEDNLWQVCEGKQVLNDVAHAIGFVDASALVQAAFAYWARDGGQIPDEITAFRQYLAHL